jgi:hypothetical protein
MELEEIKSRDSAALPPHDPRTDDFKNADTSAAQDEAPVPRSKIRLAAIIGALYLSLFLAALDATIVSTAIPTISAHFHSASGYTWIGGAYLLSNAATGPIWAKLSDIWGRKPIVLAAIAVFFLSSIVCATSVSMAMLIAGRAVQGAAGGGLVLLANITVSDLFDMRYVHAYQIQSETDTPQAAKPCPWISRVRLGYGRLRWAHLRRSSSRARFLEMDLVYQSSPSRVRLPNDPTLFGCPQSKDQDLGGNESYRLVRDCDHARSHTHDATRPRLWRRDVSLELP